MTCTRCWSSRYSGAPPRQTLGSLTSSRMSVGGSGSSAFMGMNAVSAEVVPSTHTSQLNWLAWRSVWICWMCSREDGPTYSTEMPYFDWTAFATALVRVSVVVPRTTTLPSCLAAATTPSHCAFETAAGADVGVGGDGAGAAVHAPRKLQQANSDEDQVRQFM